MNQKSKEEAMNLNDLMLFFTGSKNIITMNATTFLWVVLAMVFFATSMSLLVGKIVPEMIDNTSIIFTFIMFIVSFYFYRYSQKIDV